MAQHRMSNASGNKVAGRLVACFLDGLHNKLELLTGIAVRGKAAYIGDKRGMTAYFLNEDALEGVVTHRVDAQRCAKVSAPRPGGGTLNASPEAAHWPPAQGGGAAN